MLIDDPVANILCTVRTLRCEGGRLSLQSVYDRQRFIFRYTLSQVAEALREIKNRGYHWDQLYPDIPDSCIRWTPPDNN